MRRLLLMLALLAAAGCNKKIEPSGTESPAKADPSKTEPGKTEPAKEQVAFDPATLDPAKATETAPEQYAVKLTTGKGDIIIDVTRAWAPKGADRFYNLVKLGYFNDVRFFRVIPGFMAQVGIHGDPRVNAMWRKARIEDDPVGAQSNLRGMVTFAMGGPNTRTVQFFINFVDNPRLDSMGFPPFGKVRDMAPVDALNGEYGEGAPGGMGPDQQRVQQEGNGYLSADFPRLDSILKAEILP